LAFYFHTINPYTYSRC